MRTWEEITKKLEFTKAEISQVTIELANEYKKYDELSKQYREEARYMGIANVNPVKPDRGYLEQCQDILQIYLTVRDTFEWVLKTGEKEGTR